MSPHLVLTTQCALILVASLTGGWVPLWIHLTHARVQLAVSFVAGVMLGVGVLHLLPHAVAATGSLDRVVMWLLVGFLSMFFVERFFSFHHHDVPGVDEHGHEHHAASDHTSAHGTSSAAASRGLTWGGAALGLSLHSIMNGIALAASVEAAWSPEHPSWLAGIGTFLVIFLHKPFDALTLGTLMAVGGWTVRARHIVNALFALAIPLGAVLFLAGSGRASSDDQGLVGMALAFSAGMFICIASSDLLPELHFHQHDRIKLSIALILGITLAWSVGLLEPHDHGHDAHNDSHEAHSKSPSPAGRGSG